VAILQTAYKLAGGGCPHGEEPGLGNENTLLILFITLTTSDDNKWCHACQFVIFRHSDSLVTEAKTSTPTEKRQIHDVHT
jgi:hypothetical protein